MPASQEIETTAVKTRLPHPPGPLGILQVGDNEQDDPIHFMLGITRQYGDIVRYETPYGLTYLVNNPDLISHVMRDRSYERGSLLKLVLGEGLLSSEGEHWRKQRKLLMPEFHPRAIANFAGEIYACVLEMVQRWKQSSQNGEVVDVADELLSFTLDVVTRTLFSGELSSHAGSINHAVKTLLADIGGFVRSEFTVSFEISPSRNRAFANDLNNLNEMVYEVIARRRELNQSGVVHHDLLDLLLETRDEDGAGLSDKAVRDEMVTMLFAGNETTAVMLGWTMHCLAMHEDVDAKVREEVRSTLAGRAPSLEELPQMPYLKMTLHEVMRMFPPVWSIFRKIDHDGEVGGFLVEAGNTMIISPYTMHFHPDFWPEPERFDPYRFTFEQERDRPKYAYIPFGAGRHLCVGKHFAIMEAQIVTSVLAQCFNWKLQEGHEVRHEPLVTLRPKNGLPFYLETLPAADGVMEDLQHKIELARQN